jgi:DNA invertase Pin-like site-specific DNA recombinase
MKKDRYFLYARKSTDDEEHQILSIETQLAEVREYAKKESVVIVKEYLESKSAKVPGRPIFNAMIEEIEKGVADGLIAWHPDRLARNSIDGGRIVYLLDTGKLNSLKFPTFWFDNTPQGKFMLSIAFGQSKYYVDNLSENVMRGFRQKLRRGEWPCKAPVGYLNDPKTRTIVIDPERAEHVVQLFELYATGRYNMNQIRERALIWGLTNSHNKPVSYNAMCGLMANPIYAGSFFICGEMHEGSHKPLLTWDLFDRVQAVLRSQIRGHFSKHSFPFTAFMRCGVCGAAITAEAQRSRNYYRCTHKKGPCSLRNYLREEALVVQLRPFVERVSLPADWIEQMFSCLTETKRAERETISMSIKQTQDQLEALQGKLDRLMDLFLENSITREEFNEYKQKWIPQKQDLKTRIVSFQNQRNPPLEALEEFLNTAKNAGAVAQTENLPDIRIFLQKIGAVITLMPGLIVQVKHDKGWRILAERSPSATWPEVFEAIKAEVGLCPR